MYVHVPVAIKQSAKYKTVLLFVYSFVLFLFIMGDVAFASFSLYGEYVIRFSLPDGDFFPTL